MYSLVALFDQPLLERCPAPAGWLSFWSNWLADCDPASFRSARWAVLNSDCQAANQSWQRSHRAATQVARFTCSSALEPPLRELGAAVQLALPGVALYLCSYSEPLHAAEQLAERSPGTLQLCSFNGLAALNAEEFATRWLGDHTPVAITTQSTTAYRQHLVVETLAGEPLQAIVEEQFPAAAADSAEYFFAAAGDPARLRQHTQAMQQSCSRFIDFTTLNVIHLSDQPLRLAHH